MHTKDYLAQVEALATGSIMEDIKPNDFLSRVFIPANNRKRNYVKMKALTDMQEQSYDLWR
jgi:hypothetical protein